MPSLNSRESFTLVYVCMRELATLTQEIGGVEISVSS